LPSGNLNLPQVGKKGDEMEFLARNYLKKQGYQIIHGGSISMMEFRKERKHGKIKLGGSWSKERNKEWAIVESLERKLRIRTRLNFTSYDYLCKKGRQYFLFEVKYKIWKEGRPHFNSSEIQIWQYNRNQNLGRVKVKVLAIIEKDKKLSHHIYDWNDFEQTKTTIKLKK